MAWRLLNTIIIKPTLPVKRRSTVFRTALLLTFLAVVAQGALKEPNPFKSYLDQIAKLEQRVKAANKKQKPRYEKDLEKVKDRLSKAVETKRAPFEKKLERYEKELGKAKTDSSKKRAQQKVDEVNAMLKKIDDWAAGNDPVSPKKDEKATTKK